MRFLIGLIHRFLIFVRRSGLSDRTVVICFHRSVDLASDHSLVSDPERSALFTHRPLDLGADCFVQLFLGRLCHFFVRFAQPLVNKMLPDVRPVSAFNRRKKLRRCFLG